MRYAILRSFFVSFTSLSPPPPPFNNFEIKGNRISRVKTNLVAPLLNPVELHLHETFPSFV